MVLRYHDVVTDSVKALGQVREYLGWEASNDQLNEIVGNRERGQAPGVLQFNTGKLTRFRDEMTEQEIDFCNRKLGTFIEQLGYELT